MMMMMILSPEHAFLLVGRQERLSLSWRWPKNLRTLGTRLSTTQSSTQRSTRTFVDPDRPSIHPSIHPSINQSITVIRRTRNERKQTFAGSVFTGEIFVLLRQSASVVLQGCACGWSQLAGNVISTRIFRMS